MYLITARKTVCDDCMGKGQRPEEEHPCPNCLGRGVRGVDVVIEGRLYQLFPEEMTEIEDKSHGKGIIALKGFQGVVEVKEVRQGNRIEVDAEGAIALSKRVIDKTMRASLAQYVQEQREGPMAAGKPPIAPVGKFLEAVQYLNVDLASLGINPPAYQVERALAGQTGGGSAEVEQLRAEVNRLTELVGKLLAAKTPTKKPSHSKKPGPSPVSAIGA